MSNLLKSTKLDDVCYDIRGPVLDHANWLEDQGQKVIKLNIGNPGAFGFDAPDEIFHDVIQNLQGHFYNNQKSMLLYQFFHRLRKCIDSGSPLYLRGYYLKRV